MPETPEIFPVAEALFEEEKNVTIVLFPAGLYGCSFINQLEGYWIFSPKIGFTYGRKVFDLFAAAAAAAVVVVVVVEVWPGFII